MRKKTIARSCVLTVIALLLGFLVALQIKTINLNALSGQDLSELKNNLISYAEKNADLNRRNQELYAEIEKLEKDKAEGNISHQAIIDEKERVARFAGLRAVQNSGVSVYLATKNNHLMSDSVLRYFINELSALGAQAISINDQRHVATSEVRASNENIIINGVGMSRTEPFLIQAITDPKKEDYIISMLTSLKETVEVSQNIKNQIEITIKPEKLVVIPALSENSITFQMDLLQPLNER